jgi:hypothetical protein
MNNQLKQLLERCSPAIEFGSRVAPVLCLVDCILIPICIPLLPFFGMNHLFHGVSDQVLLLIVVALCAPLLVPDFLKHRRMSVLVLMSAGFTLMFVANYIGHNIDELVHLSLTAMGSLCLITANRQNQKAKKCCSNH